MASIAGSASRILLLAALGLLSVPTSAFAICGDGIVDCSENCDDGNTLAGDGCNQYCRVEFGFVCPDVPQSSDFSPVGHWKLDELGTATSAVDRIAGNNGTYTGAFLGELGANGQTATSVRFDGVDDYVAIPHSGAYATAAGAVAFWFRLDGLPTAPADAGLFSKDHDGLGTGGHLSLYIDSSIGNKLRYRLQKPLNGLTGDGDACANAAECAGGICSYSASRGYDICSGGAQYADAGTPPVGVWQHLVATWGPDGMALYVNGSLAASNPFTGGTTGNSEPFTLGAKTVTSTPGSVLPVTGFLKGAIDDVHIFNYQLSAADITAFLAAGTCSAPGGPCTAGAPVGCGDGALDPYTEQCDDGNTAPGDGCNALCMREFCGDGIINDSTETCDDGDKDLRDGCDGLCQIEVGWVCSGQPSVCAATWTCGNGAVEPGEVCDDPVTCSADCQRLLSCGDGLVGTGEACDDLNTVDGDGCSAACAIEPGFTCTEEVVSGFPVPLPSNCVPTCGDGVAAGWEQCDDGNTTTGDGCDQHCQIETCGDGFVRGTEQCDDGNATAGDGCSATCQREAGFICPPANQPGRCIPETVCDPDAYHIRSDKGATHSDDQACPFNETLDANADGVRDCADRKHIAVFKNLPPFEIVPGETTFALDAKSVSATAVSATIEFAPALSNGSIEPGAAFTTVIANQTASGFGDTTWRNFDLVFQTTGAFSFPGGGLIIRITPHSGSANTYNQHEGTSFFQVNQYVDTDGVYPWDATLHSWAKGIPFLLRRGTQICTTSNLGFCTNTMGMQYRCVPPPQDFPQTVAWCGSNGGTGSNCNTLNGFYWSNSTRSTGTLEYCSIDLIYRRTGVCSIGADPQTGSCSTSGSSTGVSYDDFCENCVDEDPCTYYSYFSTSSGCVFGEVAPTACWTGDPAKRNIGACADGRDYCRNPGPECIGQMLPSGETCNAVDQDCNGVIDDASVTDPQCDDGDPLTSDTCVSGACQNIQLCLGTDTECGVSVPCTDCTALTGWVANGNQGPCCDGLNSCTCDEYEYRTYYCGGTSCDYILEPVSPTYQVVSGTCTSCIDGNVCTDDTCNSTTGLCQPILNGYSGACYYGPAGTEGVGICAAGTESCTVDVLGSCDDVQPAGEACNNLDDDCNDIVDDGAADATCPVNQGCWSGQCDDECLTDGDCDPGTEFCYFENGLLPGRCAPQSGACDDVTCPGGSSCFEGSCTNTNCGNDLDCNVYSKCYNSGRCLTGDDKRCKGVQCPQGEQCVKGTCAKGCAGNTDCDPGSKCFDGFCFPEVDPCDGVDCALSDVCYQGNCFEQCLVDADCTDPADVCYDQTRCGPAADPCLDVVCAVGDICYEGGCYPVCGMTPDCSDPTDLCYDASRCATDNCDGVQCSEGEACHGGVCWLTCVDDADCTDPTHACWSGYCKVSPCDGVQCGTDQVCSGGVCYYTCLTDADCTMYDPGHACYNGFCTDDPCAGVLCPTNAICWGGTCFDTCLTDADCDPSVPICWDDFRCSTADPCLGVACGTNEICYQGACYEDCSDDFMCADPLDICWDNARCAPGPCAEVQCPSDEICYGGSCYAQCINDVDCTDPNHACYDGRCATDPCDGVQCGTGEVCYQGVCYQSCNGTIDCTDPSHVCYNNICVDPCATTTCGAGEICYLGTCYEYCDADADCSDPASICYDNRCVSAEDPWCDGVTCPTGESCYRGTCYEFCSDQADCSDPNSICYNNTCLPADCGSTRCDAGEVCYNGVCYEDCSDGTCEDPTHICYDNMRCAASACEAQAQNFIDAYDSAHVFHTLDRRLYAQQLSELPILYPRPYQDPGTNFATWAAIGAGAGASSSNDALYARGSARVLMYFDETDMNSYQLYLIQGSKDASQGATTATYSIRVRETAPTLKAMDDTNLEAFSVTPESDGWYFVQATVTTGPAETGGVAIGRFRGQAGGWRIELSADFSGDIQRWEIMNGETGLPMAELSTAEPLTIRNTRFDDSEEIQPEFGRVCDTEQPGICGRGTVTACVNWQLQCDQTVFPWNFEICDGKDNTCDGLTDALDPTLQFATVESRQSYETIWRPWPTVDSTGDVGSWLEFTPKAGDDRVGSTAAKRITGTNLQDPYKVMMAMHQNLSTGAFSMPVMAGARTSTSSIISELGAEPRVKFHVTGRGGTRMEEAAVCWYDDRMPGATNDEVLSSWDRTGQDMSWASYLEVDGGTLESDTVTIRPPWREGVLGRPTHFRLSRDLLDTVVRRWRRYAPYVAELNLNPWLAFHFRLSATDPDEAYCISDTPTPAGCIVGTYICTETGIACGPAVDDNCRRGCADWDQDGHILYDPVFCVNGTDCDDFDPETYIGAPEFCNGRDNDCDGTIDFQSLGTCSNGQDTCGPEDCNGLPVCRCPNGVVEIPGDPVDTCVCGEGLAP